MGDAMNQLGKTLKKYQNSASDGPVFKDVGTLETTSTTSFNLDKYGFDATDDEHDSLALWMDKAMIRLREDRTPLPITKFLGRIGALSLTRDRGGQLLNRFRRSTQVHISFEDDEINYKPAHYDVKNRKDLEKKLQTFAEQGFGGISLNELKDSYDHVADDVYALGAAKKIIEITKNKGRARGGPDADSMIFWRDESVDVEIDKAFVAKFRAFEHDDAVTVRKYLEDKKEPVMKEAPKQEVGRKRKRKRANNNKRARPMANSHIEQ